MAKKVLFIDRDGTIIREPEDMQIDSYEKLSFLPGVLTQLGKIAQELDFELALVTNQDGLGQAHFTEEMFWGPQNKMMEILEGEGIKFTGIHIDHTYAKDNEPTRKPSTGMLTEYFSDDYDLANSFVIGDRYTDVQLAKNLGAKGILIGRSSDTEDDDLLDLGALKDSLALKTDNWKDIYDFLNHPPRIGKVKRTTKETDIDIIVNLDGTGQAEMNTGLHFFDHMLDQLARHSGADISIQVKGDLHIDEHHTIEDTAIALGEAFRKALGDKKGIERYGSLLPMDDALAQVALDFSGRAWIVWDAEFKREKIGDMPTEMFYHFFKSFSDAAACNLNIKIEGDNEHHKIEAIFKALAKSIKMAIKRTGKELPSTKGVL
ncbi:MAG TPA: bifunctional histidinol-phosphatase/imidazoleglycerol-phosphate dehydratase HisB [Chitinophagales bacterium]|nr:bifunctional histidinol-phosphatase/imidazoleglycerol-phosphate dehydratase HisB [Chitinophagales bacterium]